jgi:RimJ/RimL family protein N-acetyltransferase
MIIFHRYLSSPKLFLRPLTEKDAGELFGIITQTLDSLSPWMDWATVPFYLKNAEDRIYSHQHQRGLDYGTRAFGIYSLDSGELIGEISAHHINIEKRSVQLGYWICTRYQKKALMREAVILLTRYLFLAQDFNTVYIHCEDGNNRSTQLPIALGFDELPILKNATMSLTSHTFNDVRVFSRTSLMGLPNIACAWSDLPLRV